MNETKKARSDLHSRFPAFLSHSHRHPQQPLALRLFASVTLHPSPPSMRTQQIYEILSLELSINIFYLITLSPSYLLIVS